MIKRCVVVLDWPAPELFPNRSNGKHWGVRQPFKLSAKQAAAIATFNTGADIGDVMIDHTVTIIIEPPDNRRRDVDGVLSALKPSLDGIAATLQIDDERFNPVLLVRKAPVDGGRITIIVEDSIPF